VKPVIDREGLCEVFGLGPGRSLGSGIFKDVFEVKPAESIVYDVDGVRKKEYWSLKAKPHLESLDETIEHMRYLVIDAIKRQLFADVPVCTFLSGGLDSSAISSVAAKEFNDLGKGTLNTYSIGYKDNEKYFKSNDFEPDPDREWVVKMAEYVKSHHNNILIDNLELGKALTDSVMACDLPGMADVDSSLYLFCKEVKKGATVALSGECADEIFGGYPWYYREDSVNADTFPWSQSVGSRRLILSKEFKNLPLEEYVKSKYEESLSAVPHLDGESKKEYRMREMFYLNIKWFMITLLNRKDRMSMSNSLEVRVPYADYRIVEYAFNVPWSMKYAYDREKGLLRAALHDILPEDVLWRKKSPYPKTHNPEYTDMVCNWMRDILGDKNSPILDIIDVDYVKELIKTGGTSYGKPWFGQLMRGPQLVAYLIQVNTWLKKYKIQIQ
jgi:asparagine synthase (glutamine-hydrolysing)